jgi:phosphatidylserine/phosphatidylglycerophosphate/cardiolipin synthase-like enzyme
MSFDYESQATEDEFVITAPVSCGADLAHKARARMTLGVLIQLIAQSKRYIVIAAPFIQRTENLRHEPLINALVGALKRSVQVNVVSTGSGLDAFNIGVIRNGFRNIHYFQPKANIENDKQLGSHAKFCLADGQHAYIGSANLTGHGLYENLEMGILVHGKIAQQIAEFWDLLIEIGFFVELYAES